MIIIKISRHIYLEVNNSKKSITFEIVLFILIRITLLFLNNKLF